MRSCYCQMNTEKQDSQSASTDTWGVAGVRELVLITSGLSGSSGSSCGLN